MMFAENRKISIRQLQVLLLLDCFGTAVLFLPAELAEISGRGCFFAALLGGLGVSAASLLLTAVGRRMPHGTVVDWCRSVCGNGVGTILLLGLAGKLLLDGMLELRIFSEIICRFMLPATPVWVLSLVLLLVAGALAAQGTECRGRTAEILAEYGFFQYEISNYARPSYACRHNIGYWTGVEYLGLGLGASSLVGGKRFQVTADLNRYLTFTKEELAAGTQYEEIHELSRQERMEEFMFLGLRKTKGISKKEFIERFGCSMDSVYGKPLIESMKQGMMKEEGDRVFLTQDGTLVSNQVLCEFLFDEEV